MKYKLALITLFFPAIVFAQAEGGEMEMMAVEGPRMAAEAPIIAAEGPRSADAVFSGVGGLQGHAGGPMTGPTNAIIGGAIAGPGVVAGGVMQGVGAVATGGNVVGGGVMQGVGAIVFGGQMIGGGVIQGVQTFTGVYEGFLQSEQFMNQNLSGGPGNNPFLYFTLLGGEAYFGSELFGGYLLEGGAGFGSLF